LEVFVSTLLGFELQHIECEQGTSHWLEQRVGNLTASRAYAAFKRNAPKKGQTLGEFSAKRTQLATALAAERISGIAAYEAPFETKAMSRGSDLEAEAVRTYECVTGACLVRSGYWQHPTLRVGVSFDAHTEDFSLVAESKCFWPAGHMDVLRAMMAAGGVVTADNWQSIVPELYHYQVRHQAAWMPVQRVDFIAYAGLEWPEESRLLVVPIERDWLGLNTYRQEVCDFLAEVEEIERDIRAYRR
jgi:hypothetical protein